MLKTTSKRQEMFKWHALPKNISEQSLIKLEKLGLIFSRNLSEFTYLNGDLKEVFDKVEKS